MPTSGIEARLFDAALTRRNMATAFRKATSSSIRLSAFSSMTTPLPCCPHQRHHIPDLITPRRPRLHEAPKERLEPHSCNQPSSCVGKRHETSASPSPLATHPAPFK